jgi:hypothetical protein
MVVPDPAQSLVREYLRRIGVRLASLGYALAPLKLHLYLLRELSRKFGFALIGIVVICVWSFMRAWR